MVPLRLFRPPNSLSRQVEKGFLGRKSGKGFYLYPKEKKGSKKGGDRELNPGATTLIKSHQAKGGAASGSSLATDVIQDRLMCR